MSIEDLRAQARLKLLRDQAKAKLASTNPSQEPTASVSATERLGNAALGAVQGATLGFGDEIGGAINSAVDTGLKGVGLMDGKVDPVADYDKYRDVSRGINGRAQAQSVGEYGAGQIAGSIPTAIATGPIAPTATLGQAVGTGAALGAAQGLGSSEGSVGNQLKDAAIGGTLGAATGGIANKIGQSIKAAPQVLDDVATDSAVKVFNPTNKQMQLIQAKGSKEIGRKLLDDGVVSFGDTAEKAATKLTDATKSAGKDIGVIYKAADAKALPEQLLTSDDLLAAMEPTLRKLQGNAATRSLAPQVEKQALDIVETYGKRPITFAEAKDLVSQLQSQAFAGGGLDPTIAKGLRQEVSQSLRNALTDRVKQVMGNNDISAANKAFGQLKTLEKPANTTLAGNKSNRAISLTDYIAGGAGGGIGALGGPAGSLVGAAAGAAGNKVLRAYGRSALASGANKLAASAEALAGMLERGAPVTEVVKRATALGLPREVIEQLQGGANGNASDK